MLISKMSTLSGKINTMDLEVDPIKFNTWDNTPKRERKPIQNEFPHLSRDQREFLITGTTPEEWNKAFPED